VARRPAALYAICLVIHGNLNQLELQCTAVSYQLPEAERIKGTSPQSAVAVQSVPDRTVATGTAYTRTRRRARRRRAPDIL
jgi:hypothetical protein